MPQILKPSNLSLTWASGGDVLNPGDTKYATGWQVEIPPRQWFNYLDNRQDTAIAHINQHGIVVWDNTTEYQEDKSYVQGSTNGTIYRCVQTHTNQNPETDLTNTYWIIAFASAGDFYTKSEADSNFLARASNLADLSNAATARNNLSVYSQAQTYTKVEVDAKTTVASTAQAQAGASNTTLITPLRLAEWSQTKALGVNQTWQDLIGSRVKNVNYTNNTGRPIQVAVSILGTPATETVEVYVAGVKIYEGDPGLGSPSSSTSCTFIVPDGAQYQVNLPTTGAITTWAELR